MPNKAAAAAALDRAEAAACRAVPNTRCNSLRRAASATAQSSCEGDVALRRCSPAALGGGSTSSTVLPWHPLDPKDNVAKFLRASSHIRSADHDLADLRSYEEMFFSLDRQLASVQRTRSMIAAACGGELPPLPHGCDLPLGGRKRLLPATAAAAAAAKPATTACVKAAAASSATEAVRTTTPAPPHAKVRAPPPVSRTVELRPFPCPAKVVGNDCACCLSPMHAADLVLTFPCPAQHAFHAGCLLKWLKAAGTKSTCPMCRSWPAPSQRNRLTLANPR